jgi:hypothetical protein
MAIAGRSGLAQVMLRMYVAWLDGTTAADIQAIKQAMEKRPAAGAAILNSRAAISSVNAAATRARLIVIRPPESLEFGGRLAVGKDLSDSSLRIDSRIKWRRGWDSNEHVQAIRINNLRPFQGFQPPSKPLLPPLLPVDSASGRQTRSRYSNNSLRENRRRSLRHRVRTYQAFRSTSGRCDRYRFLLARIRSLVVAPQAPCRPP